MIFRFALRYRASGARESFKLSGSRLAFGKSSSSTFGDADGADPNFVQIVCKPIDEQFEFLILGDA